MMRFLLLLLLPFYLYGSKILSYNIYERTDRADVMITFDTPYHGILKQSKGSSKIILKLENASIESAKIKKINSNYLKSIAITPLKDFVQIAAITSQGTILQASKTADAYGLRLRFTDKITTKNTSQPIVKTATTNPLSNLPTKKGNDLTTSYYIVVAILIVGVAILLYLRKKIQLKTNTPKQQNSWLFANTNEQTAQQPQQQQPLNENQISIRFQKTLDQNNSVVMLDFLNQSYLVLIGNGNILLDKFIDNKPTTQQEFESILQEREDELESFLANPSGQNNNAFEPVHEPLQAYKERAATLAYSED
ncbi:MAG: hypothetical protein FAF05_02905 [Epsilonproteobacteria bacterium]|nr:hypothetical protein [Campylobacterota bacterium]